jgi:secreted Zn-dependent insulinase-like peptidase
MNPKELPGLAHYLEHMVFMGSRLYPDVQYKLRKIYGKT